MKHKKHEKMPRTDYRPPIQDRQENRPTFVQFPEYTLLSMDCFKLK